MDQSFCTTKVNKSAKIRYVTDHATPHLTGLQFFESLLTPALSPFMYDQALRKNQAFAFAIYVDDLELQFPAYHILEFRFSLRVIATSSNFFACEVEKI